MLILMDMSTGRQESAESAVGTSRLATIEHGYPVYSSLQAVPRLALYPEAPQAQAKHRQTIEAIWRDQFLDACQTD